MPNQRCCLAIFGNKFEGRRLKPPWWILLVVLPLFLKVGQVLSRHSGATRCAQYSSSGGTIRDLWQRLLASLLAVRERQQIFNNIKGFTSRSAIAAVVVVWVVAVVTTRSHENMHVSLPRGTIAVASQPAVEVRPEGSGHVGPGIVLKCGGWICALMRLLVQNAC